MASASGGPEETTFLGVVRAENVRPADVALREAAAERDEAGAATGKVAQHLRAFGVARHVRIGLDRCGTGVDFDDFLAGEPAQLVEFVHAHVDEDAAAVGAERCGREVFVPLVAGGEVDAAEGAVGDALTQAAQRGDEAPPIGDLQRDAGDLGDACGLGGLGGGGAAGFLAQDRQAGGGDAADQGEVVVAGGGDQHAVEAAGIQHRVERCMHGETGLRELVADDERGFGDGGDGDCFAAGESAQMRAAHAAGADQAKLEDRHQACGMGSAHALGRSRGVRLRCASMTDWHSAMSCSASTAEVIGALPDVTQAWKWMSSSRKLSS